MRPTIMDMYIREMTIQSLTKKVPCSLNTMNNKSVQLELLTIWFYFRHFFSNDMGDSDLGPKIFISMFFFYSDIISEYWFRFAYVKWFIQYSSCVCVFFFFFFINMYINRNSQKNFVTFMTKKEITGSMLPLSPVAHVFIIILSFDYLLWAKKKATTRA